MYLIVENIKRLSNKFQYIVFSFWSDPISVSTQIRDNLWLQFFIHYPQSFSNLIYCQIIYYVLHRPYRQEIKESIVPNQKIQKI